MDLYTTLEAMNLVDDVPTTVRPAAVSSENVRRGHGSNQTIMQQLSQDKRFSLITDIINQNSSLRNELDDESVTVTFFAPTNNAMKKFAKLVKKRRGSGGMIMEGVEKGEGGDMPTIQDILQYHTIANTDIQNVEQDLFDGQLLVSQLKDRQLGRKMNQRIRVSKRFGSVYLNMFTKVESWESPGKSASNGSIQPIDWVLVPPSNAFNVIFNLPFIGSTFASAVQHCELTNDLQQDSKMTVFLPTESAWMESLHFTDLVYLFSPLGHPDLKKILQYHMCTELNYSADMINEKREFSIPTLLGRGEDLVVKVAERNYGKSNTMMRKGRQDINPNDYLIVLNSGEATVKATDIITKNGNVHVINSVLVPSSVQLPSRRFERSDEDHVGRRSTVGRYYNEDA